MRRGCVVICLKISAVLTFCQVMMSVFGARGAGRHEAAGRERTDGKISEGSFGVSLDIFDERDD